MPRRCELTGTTAQRGHNVSHSNRKTHRTFDVNLQNATFYSAALGLAVGLRVTTRAIRTVQKVGGLDAFLIKTADAKLPPEGLRLKRRVKKALGGGKPSSARSEAQPSGDRSSKPSSARSEAQPSGDRSGARSAKGASA